METLEAQPLTPPSPPTQGGGGGGGGTTTTVASLNSSNNNSVHTTNNNTAGAGGGGTGEDVVKEKGFKLPPVSTISNNSFLWDPDVDGDMVNMPLNPQVSFGY